MNENISETRRTLPEYTRKMKLIRTSSGGVKVYAALIRDTSTLKPKVKLLILSSDGFDAEEEYSYLMLDDGKRLQELRNYGKEIGDIQDIQAIEDYLLRFQSDEPGYELPVLVEDTKTPFKKLCKTILDMYAESTKSNVTEEVDSLILANINDKDFILISKKYFSELAQESGWENLALKKRFKERGLLHVSSARPFDYRRKADGPYYICVNKSELEVWAYV
ncbi:MAG: hypothetical protein ABFC94_00135 [Syntrophomonas sp.]